jgi:hypothetical protein
VATPLSGREDVSEMQIAAVGGPEASEETREVEAKAGLPMGEVFRFPDPPPPPPPKNVLRAVLFTVMGRSNRPLTCAAYDVETGLELRLSYGDDVMRSQLFRGVDAEERTTEAADAWRLALLEKGFTELE